MSASPASATVSTTLLLPQERIARAPLAGWAARLRGELAASRRYSRQVRAYARCVAQVSNNTGLVAASHGDRAAARRVCEGQLRWAHRLGRRSGDPAVAFFGVQAWINLGRLDALDGRWKAALDRFAALRDYETGGELRLDCVRVAGDAWAAAADSRQAFVQVLQRMYVLEPLKALLLSGRFDEARAFAERVEPGHPGASCAREAAVVAAAGAGDFGAARGAAEAAARESRGWDRAVFRLRAAEALACGGDRDRAAAVLAPLAAVVRQVASRAAHESLNTLYVSLRLAGACREVGLAADACALARDVLDGARAAGDEVFQVESLRVLASSSPTDERARWEGELAEAEGATEYARYRRGGRPPPSPLIGSLLAELDEAFAS